MSAHPLSSVLTGFSGIRSNRSRGFERAQRLSSLSVAFGALVLVVASGCGPGGGSEGGRCDEVLPGDLVISEFMHNVPQDRRDHGQWFEIYNPTKEDIELSGLTIYRTRHDGGARRTERLTSGVVPAGGYYVFGNAPEDELPGWIDHSYGDKLGELYLSQGRIGILCGTKVLDEVIYEGRGSENKSRAFDGSVTPDAAANDDLSRWCDSETEYAPGLFGTPGEPNDGCEPVIEDPNLCLDEETGEPRNIVRPEPGDLRITEIFASAGAVPDADGEWVELYASKDVDLNGLELRNEGTGKTAFTTATCLRIPGDSYVVLARNDDPEVNGGIDDVLATFSFNLANSGDRAVELWSEESLIDRVEYTSSTKGASRQFALETEDSDTHVWCVTPEGFTYGDGDRGTPGAANPSCDAEAPVEPVPETCVDPVTGEDRELVSPAPGDLRISEVLASVGAVNDAVGEWVEVEVRADVDLNGVALRNEGSGALVLEAEECLGASAGSHLVFARSDDPEVNGGIEDVYATFSFSLANTGPRAVLLTLGDLELDRADYTSTTKGVSWQMAERSEEDPELIWCATPEGFTYGAGDRGTPGAPNPSCDAEAPVDPVDPVDPETKTCIDPDSGEERERVSPVPGNLRITEVLPNVGAVTDAFGEWVEVEVLADVDLNDVALRNEGNGRTVLESETCLPVAEGSRIVLARSDDAAVNGGIEGVFATFSFNFANSGERAVRLTLEEVELDRVEYSSTTKGVSWQLAERSEEDSEVIWCLTPVGHTYGDGDRGTPGEANPYCEGAIVDPPEALCFDSNLGEERPVRFATPGDLIITELLANVDAVNDSEGEWIEITAMADVDLNELTVGNEGNGSTTLTSDECLNVAEGSIIVLARSDDPAENGGVEDVYATFSFNFANSGDRGARLTVDDVEIDSMEYTETTSGVSWQLAERSNVDSELTWCLTPADSVFGDGDRGTPGEPNPPCETVIVDPPEPSCFDTDLEGERPIVFAGAGDLSITEVHVNPAAVSSDVGQWVEVLVNSEVDLNGLALGDGGYEDVVFDSVTCLSAKTGERFVLARSDDALVNGGVVGVDGTFTTNLSTSHGSVQLSVDQTTIATVNFDEVDAGVSLQYAATTDEDPTLTWCPTPESAVYGDGDRGTPGEPNPPCGTAGTDPDPQPTHCIEAGTGIQREIVPATPGALTITEIHAAPTAVAAEFGQWFEVVVNEALDLNGLSIEYGGTETVISSVGALCHSKKPGERIVFARSMEPHENGGILSVTWPLSSNLPAAGTLVLGHDDVEIDSVPYESQAGVSLQLAETTNEDPTPIWCPTPESAVYGDGDRGTPGEPNPPCETVIVDPPEPTCFDTDLGEERPIVFATPGDLRISEFYPFAGTVNDAVGEWVEVEVLADVDLNDVVLRNEGNGSSALTSEACLSATEGSLIVLARSADSAENGGIEGVYGTFSFNFANSGERAVRLTLDEVELDRVDYTSTESGVSWQLAARSNEDPELIWCLTPAEHTYGNGDRGTPGEPNPPCEVFGVEPPTAMCFDVGLGEERPAVVPAPGDLLITEFLANATVRDADGEYIEIYATTDVDLNGVLVGNENESNINSIVQNNECVRLPQGEFGLIVRKSDPGVNGGLPSASIVGEFSFNLANSGDRAVRLLLDDDDRTVLTEVSYTAASVSNGISFQLDPMYFGLAASEDPANWCLTPEGNDFQGFREKEGEEEPEEVWTRGTPGEENDACPVVIPEGMCLDTATSTVRPVIVPEVGDLIITEFLAATQSGVTDANGEWIELWASQDVDLNGISVRTAETGGSGSVLNSDEQHCLHVPANSHALIARNANHGENGGLPPVIATFSITLASPNASSPERYVVLRYGNETLDLAMYDVARSGISFQLDIDSYDHLLDPEVDAVWCETPDVVSPRRTPRALNVSCTD